MQAQTTSLVDMQSEISRQLCHHRMREEELAKAIDQASGRAESLRAKVALLDEEVSNLASSSFVWSCRMQIQLDDLTFKQHCNIRKCRCWKD